MKIELMPGTGSNPRAVLGRALEECRDGDVVFVIALSGDDAHITASEFSTRDICWASKILELHALHQTEEK